MRLINRWTSKYRKFNGKERCRSMRETLSLSSQSVDCIFVVRLFNKQRNQLSASDVQQRHE